MVTATLLETGTSELLTEDSKLVLSDGPGIQSFSDDFNRVDGALGANWIASSGAGPHTIVSNAVSGGSSSPVFTRWVNPTDTDDQFAQLTYIGDNTLGPSVAMTGWADLTTVANIPTFYRFVRSSGTQVQFQQKDPGLSTFTVLSTIVSTVSANDVLRLEYVNHVLNGKKNGTSVGTYTPTRGAAISGQRYVGWAHSGAAAGVSVLDTWTGGDV